MVAGTAFGTVVWSVIQACVATIWALVASDVHLLWTGGVEGAVGFDETIFSVVVGGTLDVLGHWVLNAGVATNWAWSAQTCGVVNVISVIASVAGSVGVVQSLVGVSAVVVWVVSVVRTACIVGNSVIVSGQAGAFFFAGETVVLLADGAVFGGGANVTASCASGCGAGLVGVQ